MARLESRQRKAAFHMRREDFLSFESIGTRLGISVGAARKLFSRTRKNFSTLLMDGQRN